MKAKLQHLIKSEGLTASRFAEMLEIQPAGVSHILAGRNKPSFDLLQKILRRFQKINPDWLLLDSDQMYREGWDGSGNSADASGATGAFGGGNNFGASGGASQTSSQNLGMPAGSLFGEVNGAPNISGHGGNNGIGNLGGPHTSGSLGVRNLSPGESNISGAQGVAAGMSQSRAGFSVEKIVIFYADGTFEAYLPGIK